MCFDVNTNNRCLDVWTEVLKRWEYDRRVRKHGPDCVVARNIQIDSYKYTRIMTWSFRRACHEDLVYNLPSAKDNLYLCSKGYDYKKHPSVSAMVLRFGSAPVVVDTYLIWRLLHESSRSSTRRSRKRSKKGKR